MVVGTWRVGKTSPLKPDYMQVAGAPWDMDFNEVASPIPEGDPEIGKRVFIERCAGCHTASKGGAQYKGPNLFNVFGRRAGASPGWTYTYANRVANIKWTKEHLFDYLEEPYAFMPGTKKIAYFENQYKKRIPGDSLYFQGLKKRTERAHVIAYLETCVEKKEED